ncbi:galactose oxidase early set domain-containing protein [Pseudokineococcus lusitanus]|uniref:Uncharacterized protein DUF1929 n=1 Tax=Pseudokineococcus lusitanus TaxID=763993 RepID=A0A3N1GWJ4_9ACTN|nr:galactose oxidase early set domain-containing protein [Pseudokineococcus lusitanus]ROP34633.1 uncharacterized protein DUF1929 [Pseudokineococcus lusitanus]
MKRSTALKLRNRAVVGGVAVLLVAVNGPQVAIGTDRASTFWQESRPDYMAANGSWTTVELPPEYQLNGVHSVLLATGKVLVVAGSGNNEHHFEAGTFRTLLWDPATDQMRTIDTPEDLFCGGHAFLPNGNVLIAGGTKKYEVLESDVERAAGVLTIHNDAIYEVDTPVPVGTVFVDDATGVEYRTTEDTVLPMVRKLAGGGKEPTSVRVWVEAVEPGTGDDFTGEGHQLTWKGDDRPGLYGQADTIDSAKQDYWGLDASYEFDIYKEQYVEVGDLNRARWYPSLFSAAGSNPDDDSIFAVSGLDEYGQFIDENQGTTEEYDVHAKTWTPRPDLDMPFPTYPALFRGADGKILYSGSSTGYGPAERLRAPGTWDLTTNEFAEIPGGLREPEMNETSSSILLAPAQEQDVLVAGGGPVGDTPGSTARVDVISFDDARVTPAPDLVQPGRYVSAVNLPTDDVLLTGGSRGYRGSNRSDNFAAQLYTPATNTMEEVAPNHVGRNYHSEALLLPDGSVLTLGSDPLYGDAENETAGTFEKRFEIYQPPYFFTEGARPMVLKAPESVERGTTFEVRASGNIASARLVRPSAVTHVTDTEQRSVALDVERTGSGALALTLDANENLTPAGHYMLFLVDENGKPSVAQWVHVP